ncbi:heme lyase CcmF/NrfE family subunit [Pseudoroseicyclus sp. CXY001]|uniref:heme lyase CcmF/NrfE family subunit n=1 Tax=Pseudoroseicyclus sp. CXY001 TaxID=3242492 RepID=UPI00358DC624
MTAELGHFALILALIVAVLQTVVPAVGRAKLWEGWMAFAGPAALAQFLVTGLAFAALMRAFMTSDFSLALVADNSHSAKPMLYKIAGTWGNHEGSMLLWLLILALFGAAAAAFGGNLPLRLKALVLAVQGAIGAAFAAFILFTSNPFLRLASPPFDGADLNPLLQDPGLAFHPPFLYLGYVGLSMSFSFAIAALIEGKVDAAWARWVRPWTLAAWIFLTIGIAMGSWWAYYELGWGGFWFWDPVENASFMPWLIAGALLHSAIVAEKREALKSWTILLAILAFGFSLLGTFLVRSGVITSVHAFATDPTRGVAILVLLAIFVGGGLTLYAARAGAMQAKGVFGLVSRESALVVNNVLLATACFIVFLGTLWPLFAEVVLGRVLSVGAPFFNAAFVPVFLGLAVILPIGSVLAWKRGRIGRAARDMAPALALALAIGALAYALLTGRSAVGALAAGIGAFVIFGALTDAWLRAGRQPRRLLRLPRADWGRVIAHGALGVTILGIAILSAGAVEDIRVVQEGETFPLGRYEVTLAGVEEGRGPNYLTTMADMELSRGGRLLTHLYPEKRVYPVAGMPTTEAAIDSGLFRDVYLVLGDPQESGGWAVRAYIKPFAGWIWGGSLLMALGGLLSLTDRRLRVAAGAKPARPAPVAAE